MKPTLFGYSSWYVLWTFAAVVGTAFNYVGLRRRGVPRSSALVLLGVVPVVAIMGAKMLYLLENGLPLSDLGRTAGYRMPGGLVAMAIAFPVLCRLVHVRTLVALDAFAPGVILTIAIGRIGCFLSGCCFGTPTDLPWAVVYPPRTPAHTSHRVQHGLPLDAPGSLPCHPLSLYFSVDSLAIFAFLLWLAPRARYPGQVFLWFVVLRTWSKAALETLRGYDVGSGVNRSGEVELVVAVVASAVLLAVTLWGVVRDRNGRHPVGVPPAPL